MITDKQTAEVLLSARDYLAEGNWCQHRLRDDDGRRCILGALGWAELQVFGNGHCVCLRVALKLRPHLPDGRDIAVFNDAPETTLADVLDLFDKALADLGALALEDEGGKRHA